MVNIAVLSSGNGTSIEKLLNKTKNSIKIIITNKKNAGIIEKAKLNTIPFIYLPKMAGISAEDYDINICNILRVFKIKHVFLVGFMRIITHNIFEEFNTVNIHPSLLPSYSMMMDMEIHRKVLLNKDQITGCTLHKVTEIVDGGDIILQKTINVEDGWSARDLKSKVQELESECFIEYYSTLENKKINYSVNIEEGNSFVKKLPDSIKTKGFCSLIKFDNFTIGASTDGVGTKLDLAIKYNKLDKIGIDLVAMNVNDLIAGGVRPVFFMDYIAIDKMNQEKCSVILKGINEGCKLSGCKLVGGETAEMRGLYFKNKLDLAGFAVGKQVLELPLLDIIKEEDYIYGIPSSGLHSNGYSLVNELLENGRLDENDSELIDKLLEPTIIYNEVWNLLRCNMHHIKAMAHITGGGYEDNISRVIPDNLKIKLFDWELPDIFKIIQEASGLSRKEMMGIFNCGYGMAIISKYDIDLPIIGKLVRK